MPQPLLTLDRATIGYHGNPVLREVSLEIFPGDAIAVLGPNGSGKTTLLKTLGGILPPLVGHRRLSWASDEQASHVGYVPQRATLSALLPLTAREIVEMGTYGRLRPWQGLGRLGRERVEWAMEEGGIAALGRELYAKLSGGQQQRVLIARALVAEPDILFLDEPLASLDQQAAQALVALLKKLRAESTLAMVWADHLVPGMRAVVQEAMFLQNGGVLRGKVDEVLERGRASEAETKGTDS